MKMYRLHFEDLDGYKVLVVDDTPKPLKKNSYIITKSLGFPLSVFFVNGLPCSSCGKPRRNGSLIRNMPIRIPTGEWVFFTFCIDCGSEPTLREQVEDEIRHISEAELFWTSKNVVGSVGEKL